MKHDKAETHEGLSTKPENTPGNGGLEGTFDDGQ
jgi:hypothetical protein